MNPEKINPFNKKTVLELCSIIVVGFIIWNFFNLFNRSAADNAVYFLNVGQGDSQLLTIKGEDKKSEIKILIDGGRDRRVLTALDDTSVFKNENYLDIVLITHEDFDHIGGIASVLENYDVGLFVWNGREGESAAFQELKKVLSAKKIPTIVLLEGDKIRYGDAVLKIISPDKNLLASKESNDASIVLMEEVADTKTLLTGDATFLTEKVLLEKGYDLKADILKVGHHGSKYSSSDNFVAAIRPVISGIGVGKNNYGHPTERVLDVLNLAGSRMYRTDLDGTVKIILDKEFTGTTDKKINKGFLAALGAIMTGSYRDENMKTVSLPTTKKEEKSSNLVSYKTCSFKTNEKPKRNSVIFNEIAWMGALTGATHEWLELKNISGGSVNMSGWQILNENEKLKIIFPQQKMFDNKFFVLARNAANEALSLNADLVFTGAIRNEGEALRLFDNNCNLIDEVKGNPKWQFGDNKTKRPMARDKNLNWFTSYVTLGTPGKENR